MKARVNMLHGTCQVKASKESVILFYCMYVSIFWDYSAQHTSNITDDHRVNKERRSVQYCVLQNTKGGREIDRPLKMHVKTKHCSQCLFT